MNAITPASAEDLQVLEEQLGRVPRDRRALYLREAHRCCDGSQTRRRNSLPDNVLPDQSRSGPRLLDT